MSGDGETQRKDAKSEPTVAPVKGLACLVMLAQYFEKPCDPAALRHEFGESGRVFDEVDLLRAAKSLGFKAKAVDVAAGRLDRVALPAIAELIPLGQEPPESQLPLPPHYVILAKLGKDEAGGDKVLIQDPLEGKPEALELAAFQVRWTGRVVQVATRAQLAAEQRRFDVSWFIPAIVKYRRLFGEVLLASLFIQVFALISPLFFQVVIDKVLVHRGMSSLDVLIFALVVVSIFEVIFGTLRTYLFSHTTNRVDVQLGSGLFKHLMQLPIAYFGARRVGETVARVRELENVRNFLTGSALTLVVDLGFTVIFFAVMFYYAPLLTWIVVGSLPFYVAVSALVTPILRKRVEEMFARGAENQAFLVESVTGVETVKAMAVEPQFHRRWEERLAEYVKISFKTSNLGNIASNAVQGVQKLTMAITLYYGAKLVMEGDLTVGQLVAFNMLSGRVAMPIVRLAQLWQDFQQMRISIERLGDILNTRTEVAGGQANLPPIEGRVVLDGVTFRYRPDTPAVLKNVSLEVPRGQVVGIVGPSGSGKSTLTKLIQRMYVPEAGRVSIDGIDLALVSPAWLRRQVGVVLQENFLFNRPAWENIALSDPGMGKERVMEAAKLAGAHDFILELPEAYDTVIGERGGTLSGGQRQRIAIARALVTNPRILIFDEATSALDYESEEIIQRNMRRICVGRTVFIIAHRLSTVRDCDRIITVEKGEIVEDGTHEDLLRSGGRYSKLWASQSATTKPPQPPQDPHPIQVHPPQAAPTPLASRRVKASAAKALAE